LFKQNENIFIPFSYAKGLIWDIILNEYKISDFPISSLSIVLLNSLVYFIIGLIMFNYFEKIAMKKGIQS
jgi:ABC-2 type transport system permease protein